MPGAAQQVRRPKNFVAYLKMLVGKGADTANLQWLKDAHYPHEWTSTDEGTLQVQLAATGLGDDMNQYSVVELLSMLLTKQREDAEALAEEPIKDVVITVPPYWAQDERQALLDAAELAKMNVLGLMNENSAVAMKYAIDKKYDATKEHNVVFYDMGSTSVKTSLVSFYTDTSGKKEKDAFKVLAVAWDEGCGGHVIDSRLATRFAKEFDEKHKGANDGESVLENVRAMARLRIAGKKTKETLSANQETPVTVEALSNDIDFRSKLSREDFNEMNQDLWERAIAPVQKLLDDTGMSTSDIHAAVIVGGSSLIPKVQEQLKAKLGIDELTRNLDAFESAALGAGFYAAGLSPSFRVREVGVTDLYPFGVSATVSKSLADAEGDEVETVESVSEVVFEPKEPVPNRKYLVFSRSSNFTVSLKYTNPEVMSPDTETEIGVYNMTGVNKCAKFNTTDKPKITLKLEIDRNGMATVTEAAAGVTEWTEKSVKIPRKKKKKAGDEEPKKKSKKSKDTEEDESGSDGNEPEPEKDSAEGEAADTNTEDAAESEVVEEPQVVEEHKCAWNATLNVTLGEGEDAKEKEVQPYIGLDSGKNKTMTGECANVNPEYEGDIELMCFEAALTADTSDCTVVKYELRSEKVARKVDLRKKYRENGISKMTKSKKDDANGRLGKIQKIMDEIHRLAKSKNDVEAHIFETRDMLEYNEEVKAVMSDEQADEVRAGLSAAEEWMWEDYTYSEYVDKLYELRDAIKPALIRKDEAVSRPQVLARAHEAITKTQATLANESYMELMPANETERMVEKTASFELYVKEKEEAQAALSLTDEPAFMSAEMEAELSKYEKAMAAAMAKKPKPKKAKKPTKKAKKPAADLVSYETNAEQLAILTDFYAELKEDKSEEDIQAILDKRKEEGADALTKPQFKELCEKLKIKKFINPIELWAEKHPPAPEEGDGAEEEADSGGGGWFSGWGSGSGDAEDGGDAEADGGGDAEADAGEDAEGTDTDGDAEDAETDETDAEENQEDGESTDKDDL